jgi:hypothetical protein
VGRWKKHPRFVAEVDHLCAPALPPGDGPVERVHATRVTALSKVRRANVEYPTFETYKAAICASGAIRGR